MKSLFQITAFTRLLMTVGRICDEVNNITFDAVMGVVRDTRGTEICRFQRQQGGLYVATMKLNHPMVLPSWNEQTEIGPCNVLKTAKHVQ